MNLTKYWENSFPKFSVTDFFSKCDQIRKKMWVCSHLLKKSLMENLFFGAVRPSILAVFCNALEMLLHAFRDLQNMVNTLQSET